MGVARSWLRAPDVSYRANEYVSGSPGNVGGGSTFPKPWYGVTETFIALQLNKIVT